MVRYNYNGRELLISVSTYIDGHTAIIIKDGENEERLTTNFSKKDLGRELNADEIYICMTPSWEHPMVRNLALDMEENGFIFCMYDFIRTYNEYYRYKIPKATMEMLESSEIIEYVPEGDDDENPFEYGTEWECENASESEEK